MAADLMPKPSADPKAEIHQVVPTAHLQNFGSIGFPLIQREFFLNLSPESWNHGTHLPPARSKRTKGTLYGKWYRARNKSRREAQLFFLISLGNGAVFLDKEALSLLPGKGFYSLLGFGKKDQPFGFIIQPVEDPPLMDLPAVNFQYLRATSGIPREQRKGPRIFRGNLLFQGRRMP
jgi:hypothetical protein